ncbi:MAG: hypothetical protein N2746_12180 [Deltaproteobacteria bacterium]|nr:hypothetical protein [Deltaproteobacteria bacterium]
MKKVFTILFVDSCILKMKGESTLDEFELEDPKTYTLTLLKEAGANAGTHSCSYSCKKHKDTSLYALKELKIYTLAQPKESGGNAGLAVAHIAVANQREAVLKALEDPQILLKDSQGKTVKQVIEYMWGLKL